MFSFFLPSNYKIFKKMGFYNDQDGIMRRYLREADQWKSHLENTKTAILKAIDNKGRNRIAILGSGWLLDVPYKELSAKFDQVLLFDIKHPSQIKRKVEKHANIKLVETDISGFALTIYNLVRDSKKSKTGFSIDAIKPQFDFDLGDFDVVVSCNVLNQLDMILIDYLKRYWKISANTESQLRKIIQEAHINILPKSRSCLISDVQELSVDNQKKIVNNKSLVYTDLIPQISKKEWIWHFDNHFAYRTNWNTWFKVVVLNL